MLPKSHHTRPYHRFLTVLLALLLIAGTTVSFGTPDSYAADANITISGKTVPTTLSKGQFFTIKGTIKSDVTIKRVRIGIQKTDGTWLYKYDNTSVNAKTFDINKADSAMSFSKLGNGTYYYRIYVTPSGEAERRILNAKFTVGTTSSTTTTTSGAQLVGANYPSKLEKGKSFTVKGTVKSTKIIQRVRVGIIKPDGTWLYKYDNKTVNAKTFDINKADSKMCFSKLGTGTYYYRIYVTLKGGTEKRLLNAKFTVGTTNTATLSGANYPTKLEKGTAYSVKGTIKDTKKITKVKIGIVDSSNTWKYTYLKSGLSSYSYDISKAASTLSFAKLPKGTYFYRIYAWDSAGSKRLLNQKFTVVEEFEDFMTAQGFPASYKTYLRKLHAAHPTWKFYAQKTGVTWDYAVNKEFNNRDNYVEDSDPWYMKVSTDVYDGRWNLATKKTIAYYMDPRNFLTEQNVYQFLDQREGKGPGGSAHTARLLGSSTCSWNTSSYITWINDAGAKYDVKPNVMAAMIIMEQGWNGAKNGLVSGTYTGKMKAPMDQVSLKGYYNFFNVGAYGGTIGSPYCSTKISVNSTQRGLWYAAGQPNSSGVRQATSYGRPWNTKAKSISGGVQFYSKNYIQQNQYTYYTKKFNVIPPSGTSFGDHQYMTNVDGANSEGNLLRRSYTADEKNLVFRIPVYTNMPSTKCPKPTEKNH